LPIVGDSLVALPGDTITGDRPRQLVRRIRTIMRSYPAGMWLISILASWIVSIPYKVTLTVRRRFRWRGQRAGIHHHDAYRLHDHRRCLVPQRRPVQPACRSRVTTAPPRPAPGSVRVEVGTGRGNPGTHGRRAALR